tara:strand:- start:79 stop:810 length:732 start_codon:yes stop_codon:yes gene_type:complete
MDLNSQKTFSKFEDEYWWFVGRRIIIKDLLTKNFKKNNLEILDWGCGTGKNYSILSKYGNVLGVDSSEHYIDMNKKKGILNVLHTNNINEFKPKIYFDLVTNFDVLEHIKKDDEYLKKVNNLLKPNGHILITVPAYQFIWTKLDHVLGHQRRYNKKKINVLLEKTGYEIIQSSYFFMILSPPFIVVRLFQKFFDKTGSLEKNVINLPRLINKFFILLLKFESNLIKFISLPFGTSIIVLAKKK